MKKVKTGAAKIKKKFEGCCGCGACENLYPPVSEEERVSHIYVMDDEEAAPATADLEATYSVEIDLSHSPDKLYEYVFDEKHKHLTIVFAKENTKIAK